MTLLEKKSTPKQVRSESVKIHNKDYHTGFQVPVIKYFIEKDRPTAEKIYWVALFLICVVLNSYLINNVWNKWNDSPVIVSFAETTTPVWNVPFPAVTVCSEVKSRATVFNFSSYISSNETDDFIEKAKGDISLLCDDHVNFDGEDFVDDTTMDFLMEVAPPLWDTIFLCKWKNVVSQNCSDIFTRTVTDEGICYTFNMLNKEDIFRENVITYFESNGLRADGWTHDGGYSPDAELDNYPYRALQSGTPGGLFTVLTANREDADYYCRGPVQGFKILLHNPAEFPKVGESFLRVPLNQEVLLVVQPSIMMTSENLQSYSPYVRQCYFPSERYLSYFKVYTQANCELECLTNYTQKECGCVALHMPRMEGTNVCGPRKKQCMIDAAQKLRMIEVTSAFRSDLAGSCDCLPACTSINYKTESSQADFNFHAVLEAYGDNVTAYSPYDASRLSIFFKDKQFTTSRRNEFYGLVDFLANCGGLLGLFCGMSLLTIVQLIYYTTLQIWGNIKVFKETKKKNYELQCIKINDENDIYHLK